MTPLEVAAGWVFGSAPSEVAPARRANVADAVRCVEDAITEVRGDRPCFVAFSGGRDSSVVLALAVRAARREGLPEPVPLTDFYPDAPDSHESSWQETVIRHLGLHEWIRRDATGESDMLGPDAQDVLLRFGLLWPPAAHINRAFYAVATGGVLLTGEGGDNVFGAQRVTPLRRLARRRRSTRNDAKSALRALLPGTIRGRRAARETERGLPWLQPDARREVGHLFAAEAAKVPLHWYRAMLRGVSSRAMLVGLHNLDVMARDVGTILAHPLLDRSFLGALAPLTGQWGHPDRASLMGRLFADVLPPEVVQRSSKARFNDAYFGTYSREFARSWDRTGVDPQLVDATSLHEEWLAPEVHAMTFLLLQQAWLSSVQSRPAQDRQG